MATYDHKQVFADYSAGRITPEMAVGHSLQHINQLYEAQATARTAWQPTALALDGRISALQVAVDRLTTLMGKVLRTQKKRTDLNPPNSNQP